MKRLFVAAAVVMAISPLVVTNVALAAPGGSSGCVEPVPQRSYESELLTYSVAVDYSRCDWWTGGQIVLEAALSRLDGQGEAGTDAFALCGHVLAQAPTSETSTTVESEPSGAEAAADPDVETAAAGSATCAVLADLEHPTVEAALYRGRVTYPWEGGERTVTFAAVCGPTAGCVDLPADPSPALGVASDLYDNLTGGGDAG